MKQSLEVSFGFGFHFRQRFGKVILLRPGLCSFRKRLTDRSGSCKRRDVCGRRKKCRRKVEKQEKGDDAFHPNSPLSSTSLLLPLRGLFPFQSPSNRSRALHELSGPSPRVERETTRYESRKAGTHRVGGRGGEVLICRGLRRRS